MNDFKHYFDPAIQPVFSDKLCEAASKHPTNSRYLFYKLLNVDENYTVLPVAHQSLKVQLLKIQKDYKSRISSSFKPESIDSLLAIEIDFPQLYPEHLDDYLHQLSPVILTEPRWFAAVSQAVTCFTPSAINLMSMFLKLTNEGSYIDLYQAVLKASGIKQPALHSMAFAEQEAINDGVYDLAVVQLILTCFPRVFFPELLGLSLAYCQSPAQNEDLLSLINTQSDGVLERFISLRKSVPLSLVHSISDLIHNYLSGFREHKASLWLRIQTGFWLYKELNKRCSRQFKHQFECPQSPNQALAKLLINKASSALGHHRKVHLSGKSLDDWFAEQPFDSKNFLTALRNSSHIDNLNPQSSPLLKLFEFNGPMFGVLNASELTILKNGLSDHTTNNARQDKRETFETKQSNPPYGQKLAAEKIDVSNLSNRRLFYYLINIELYPDVLDTAKKRVNRVFWVSKFFNRMPMKRYSHQLFDEYVNSIYGKEIKSYKPIARTPKISKETYVWGIEQFAPTILTDGCWLQHMYKLSRDSDSNVFEDLFKIYSDEIGAGVIQQNHPRIYQDLLDSLSIKLPTINSSDFVNHSHFVMGAFDIPVYLLAISNFPRCFFPELLGLNLAIELNGLGKLYMSLADDLKYWKINSAIVNVHISIDNIGSGHAALAKQSIKSYLDKILAFCGEQEMQKHWQRIYTGFCSLNIVSCRFKVSLLTHYLLGSH